MKCKSIGLRLGAIAGTAYLVFLLAGCEVDSANRTIEIQPDSAVLKYGQSVTLNALDGYVYEWSLSDNTLGILNTRRGSQVVYTSIIDPPSPVVQTITVTSTFSDNTDTNGNGTNTPVVHTAEAYITQIPATNNIPTT